jgi:hypothetical protein
MLHTSIDEPAAVLQHALMTIAAAAAVAALARDTQHAHNPALLTQLTYNM